MLSYRIIGLHAANPGIIMTNIPFRCQQQASSVTPSTYNGTNNDQTSIKEFIQDFTIDVCLSQSYPIWMQVNGGEHCGGKLFSLFAFWRDAVENFTCTIHNASASHQSVGTDL